MKACRNLWEVLVLTYFPLSLLMIRSKTNVPGNESNRSIKQLALKVNDLVRSDRSTNKTKNFDGK